MVVARAALEVRPAAAGVGHRPAAAPSYLLLGLPAIAPAPAGRRSHHHHAALPLSPGNRAALVVCGTAAPSLSAQELAGLSSPWGAQRQEQQAEEQQPFNSRFALGARLGQGSHGTVYAAVELATGQEVAVKVVPKQRFGGRAQRGALQKEANIWRRACAASRQATRILSMEEDFANFYIVQERCRGGSLQQVLDVQGGLVEDELSEVAFCVLTFLDSMHRNNIYFGDLKPGNVILKDEYTRPCPGDSPDEVRRGCLNVKVVDFGCSQLVSGPLRAVAGTPLFSSPELIGGSYGLPADMWALGVMLYTLVSNRLPFWLEPVGDLELLDVDAVYSSILHSPVIFAGARWRGVSEPLKDLICSLLEKDPEQRLTAAQALEHPWFAAAQETCSMLD